jgi:hypothetical protein
VFLLDVKILVSPEVPGNLAIHPRLRCKIVERSALVASDGRVPVVLVVVDDDDGAAALRGGNTRLGLAVAILYSRHIVVCLVHLGLVRSTLFESDTKVQ